MTQYATKPTQIPCNSSFIVNKVDFESSCTNFSNRLRNLLDAARQSIISQVNILCVREPNSSVFFVLFLVPLLASIVKCFSEARRATQFNQMRRRLLATFYACYPLGECGPSRPVFGQAQLRAALSDLLKCRKCDTTLHSHASCASTFPCEGTIIQRTITAASAAETHAPSRS
jgi:hypothetical protein